LGAVLIAVLSSGVEPPLPALDHGVAIPGIRPDPFTTAVSDAALPSEGQSPEIGLHAVRADTAASGSAILSVRGGEQRLFDVGEEIAPGLRLLAVGTDHVVVSGPGGGVLIEFPPSEIRSVLTAMEDGPEEVRPGNRGSVVVPHSAGALTALGLSAGDRIISIGGSAPDPDRIQAQIADAARSGAQIRIERGGKELEIDVGGRQ